MNKKNSEPSDLSGGRGQENDKWGWLSNLMGFAKNLFARLKGEPVTHPEEEPTGPSELFIAVSNGDLDPKCIGARRG